MDDISTQRDSHMNLMNLIIEQSALRGEDSELVGCAEVVETASEALVDGLIKSTNQHDNIDRQCSFNNQLNSAEFFRNVNNISDDLINKQIIGDKLVNEHHPVNTRLDSALIAKQIDSTNSSNLIDQISKLVVSQTNAPLNGHSHKQDAIGSIDRLKRSKYWPSKDSKINSNTYHTFANDNQTSRPQTDQPNDAIWGLRRLLNRKRSGYEKIDGGIDEVKILNERNKLISQNQLDQFKYVYQQSPPLKSSNSFESSPITNFFQSVITTQRNMTAGSGLDQSPDLQSKSPNKLSRANSYVSSTGIQLKQNLGLLNGVCIIVGVIVGSGIFISPKGVLETSHSVGLSLGIWICCGLLSLIGALCYAELGCAIPKSGGDYAYIREAFGDLPAFLFLWVATLIIMPTGNAIAALTFANYVLVPYYRYTGCGNPPEQAVQLIATILVCFLTFVNCYNVRLTAKLMDACTFAKVFALTIIIGVGFWQITRGSTQNFENAFQGSSTSPQQIALSFYAGLFSYAGWNFLNFVTEELKDPFRTLPKAIYISLPLVTVIYVLANVAYFTVLSPAEIIDSNAVAITFGDRVLGIFGWTMPVFVVLSTFGGLNGSIFASSRLFFVGARNGHLPRILGQINVHYVTPVPSLLFMCLTTLVYLSTANVYLLINYTAFNESLFITLSVAALLWLRYTQPDLERPIKVNIILPIFFFVVCTFLVLLPVFERPMETGISALITLTGVPVYLVTIAWKNKPDFYNRINDSITKFLQVLLITVEEKRS